MVGSALLWELGNSGLKFRHTSNKFIWSHGCLIYFLTFCLSLCFSSLAHLPSVLSVFVENVTWVRSYFSLYIATEWMLTIISCLATLSLNLLFYLLQSLQSKEPEDLSKIEIVSCHFCALISFNDFSLIVHAFCYGSLGLTGYTLPHTPFILP